jgi:hypothetical protein
MTAHPATLNRAAPACSGKDPELWFAHYRASDEAINTCRQCPVKDACLDYAHKHDVRGIWAATTYTQRCAYRRTHGIEALPVQIEVAVERLPRPVIKPTVKREEPTPEPTPELASRKGLKHCPRCRTSRALSDFYSNKANPDGLAVWCKPCFRERSGT